MDEKLKRQIRTCDIFVGIIVFLVLGIHMMTNFFMALKSTETKSDIESVAKVYETNIFYNNPFISIKAMTDQLITMIFMFIKPAMVLFFYWLIRKKTKEGKAEIITLQSYVVVAFLVLIINFLNDLSILAGMLARGGV